MNTENKWNDLTLKDKAYLIKQAVASGYKSLDDILNLYDNRYVNTFGGGGKKGTKKKKSSTANTLVARAAFDKYFELHPNSQFNTPDWKEMLWDLIGRESSYDINAVSAAGARGYALLMPENIRAYNTNGDFYDPYNNMLASFKYWDANKKALDNMLRKNFKMEDLLRFQNKGWDIYGMMAAAHLGGVEGLKNFLKQGLDNPDAYGTTRTEYLNRFSRVNKNRPLNIENTSQRIYTPDDVTALFQEETQQPQQQIIVPEYNGPTMAEVLNTLGQDATTVLIKDPKVQLIQNNTDNYRLEKAYDYRQNLLNRAYLPLTERFTFNNEVQESPVLKLLKEKPLYNYLTEDDKQQELLNDLLERAINNSMSNSTFKYALADSFAEGGLINKFDDGGNTLSGPVLPTFEIIDPDAEPEYPDWYYRGDDPGVIYSINDAGSNNIDWLKDKGTTITKEGNITKYNYPQYSKIGKNAEGTYFAVVGDRAFQLNESPLLSLVDTYDAKRREYERTHRPGIADEVTVFGKANPNMPLIDYDRYQEAFNEALQEEAEKDAPKVGLNIHNQHLLEYGLLQAKQAYDRKKAADWNAVQLLGTPVYKVPEATGVAIDKGLDLALDVYGATNPLILLLPDKGEYIKNNIKEGTEDALTLLSPSRWIGSLASGFNYAPYDPRNNGIEDITGDLGGWGNLAFDIATLGAAPKAPKVMSKATDVVTKKINPTYYKAKQISKAIDEAVDEGIGFNLPPEIYGGRPINSMSLEDMIQDQYKHTNDNWTEVMNDARAENSWLEGAKLDIDDLKTNKFGIKDVKFGQEDNSMTVRLNKEGLPETVVRLLGYSDAIKEAYDFYLNDVFLRLRKGENRKILTKDQLHKMLDDCVKEITFKYEKDIGGKAYRNGNMTINPLFGPSVELFVHELRHLLSHKMSEYFGNDVGADVLDLLMTSDFEKYAKKDPFKSATQIYDIYLNDKYGEHITGLPRESIDLLENAYEFLPEDVTTGRLNSINPLQEKMASNTEMRKQIGRMSGKENEALDQYIREMSEDEILDLMGKQNGYTKSFKKEIEERMRTMENIFVRPENIKAYRTDRINAIKDALIKVGSFTGGMSLFDKIYNQLLNNLKSDNTR